MFRNTNSLELDRIQCFDGPDVMWVQTVSKGYQQTPLAG